ncbi:MAG: FCD domain-containing protein [Anaerolineaceae bacterium]
MKNKSELLDYLAEAQRAQAPIPSIPELSHLLGISVASVREQLEVARTLGFVDVKTKVGIQNREFSLNQCLELGLRYGAKVQPNVPDALRDLRKHIEISYWHEAAPQLTSGEIQSLYRIVEAALVGIGREPTYFPQTEHREFHMLIFAHLENQIAKNILETFWKLTVDYERNLFPDRAYLENVWNYHRRIADALAARDYERGYQWLVEHMDLVKQRKKVELSQRFE